MEALLAQLLLTLGLAVLPLLAFFRSTAAKQSRGGAPTQRDIIVRDPAIVQLTLVEHADAFANRPAAIFPTGLKGTHSINSVPYGPMWRALRCNLTAEILHPTRLHRLAALQQEAAAALVADLSARARRGGAGGEVMVVRDILHASLFALSARVCFGDDGVAERYLHAIERELVQFVSTFVQDLNLFRGSSWMTKFRHWRRWLRWSGSLNRVYKLVQPIIAARRQSTRTSTTYGGIPSYLDSLLDLQFPDSDSDDTNGSKQRRPLTDMEMVRLAFEFLSVTTESVMACVEWTLAHLAIDPEVQNKLHHEITTSVQQDNNGMVVSEERLHRRLPYLRAVMLESLRLHPPVPVVLRHVSAKYAAIVKAPAAASSTDGMPAIVVMDVHKIGRNNKLWTDPGEFRPERFLAGGEGEEVGPLPAPKDVRMVPFGAGPRYCPGVELGMVRVGCILTALVRDLEWAVPPDSNSIDLKASADFFTLMTTPLRARITPRTPLSTSM